MITTSTKAIFKTIFLFTILQVNRCTANTKRYTSIVRFRASVTRERFNSQELILLSFRQSTLISLKNEWDLKKNVIYKVSILNCFIKTIYLHCQKIFNILEFAMREEKTSEILNFIQFFIFSNNVYIISMSSLQRQMS